MKQKTKTKVLFIFVLIPLLVVLGFQLAQYHANANEKMVIATMKSSVVEEETDPCLGGKLNQLCPMGAGFCVKPYLENVPHKQRCYPACRIGHLTDCKVGHSCMPMPGFPDRGFCLKDPKSVN